MKTQKFYLYIFDERPNTEFSNTTVKSTYRILFTLNVLVNMNIVIFKQENPLLFLIALLNLKRRFVLKTQCFGQTLGLIH